MLGVETRPPMVVEYLPNDGFLNSTPGTQAASGSAPLDEADIVRRCDENASIVLIGVRGAGKRSLGFIAATHLGRRFIAEGLYFQQITGISKVDYLNLHGTADFHRRALEVFRQMLEQNDHNCVIECGMRSLAKEAQEVLRQYAKSHPVIQILRNFDHVGISNIKQIEQLKEADLNHRTCSNFEFYNLYDCTCLAETEVDVKTFNRSSAYILQDVKAEFQDYVNFITGHTKYSFSGPFSLSALPLEEKARSYATPLRLSELLAHSVNAGDLESGEDAVELIVDAWKMDMKTVLSKQISVLRRKFGIPIILSLLEEGLDPSKPKPMAFSDLMDHGIRLGVDYIIIDALLPKDHQERLLLSKGRTKAIADHLFRDPAPGAWLHQGRISICERAEREGYDLVRLRQHALERQDNADVQHFVRLASQSVDIPIIAYNLEWTKYTDGRGTPRERSHQNS
jgi:shikimate kinase